MYLNRITGHPRENARKEARRRSVTKHYFNILRFVEVGLTYLLSILSPAAGPPGRKCRSSGYAETLRQRRQRPCVCSGCGGDNGWMFVLVSGNKTL